MWIAATLFHPSLGTSVAFEDDEYIGMVRREVLDDFLRQRAKKNGATLINGLFMGMTLPEKTLALWENTQIWKCK